MDLSNTPRDFSELNIEDKDLTMFTLTQLRLEKQDQVGQMPKISSQIQNTNRNKFLRLLGSLCARAHPESHKESSDTKETETRRRKLITPVYQ